jgi:hypothetical protein
MLAIVLLVAIYSARNELPWNEVFCRSVIADKLPAPSSDKPGFGSVETGYNPKREKKARLAQVVLYTVLAIVSLAWFIYDTYCYAWWSTGYSGPVLWHMMTMALAMLVEFIFAIA